MKRNLFAISIMALLAAVGCKEETEQPAAPDRSEHVYTFEAATATKATLGDNCVEWEDGDKIGTFAKGQPNASGIVNVGTPCTFQVKTTGTLEVGDKVYAYAPYSKSAGTNASELAFCISSEQSTGHIAMPLAAVPFEVTERLDEGTDAPVAGLNFCNLASVVRLLVYSDGTVAAGEKIQSVTVSSTADICGSYTIDLTAIDPSKESTLVPVQTNGEKAVTVTLATAADVATGKESAVEVPIVLAAGSYPVTVIVNTDKASYLKSSSEDIEFIRNHRKPVAFNIAEAKPCGVEIAPSDLRSYARGESFEYDLTLTGVSDAAVTSCPAGWTAVIDGEKLKVTAPSEDSQALEGKVVITAGGFPKSVDVRRAGVNSKDEFIACITAIGRDKNAHATAVKDAEAYAASLAPYMVDGWVSLNADFTLTADDFCNNSADLMYQTYEKIDGNDHTVTFDVKSKSTDGFTTFAKYIDKDVKNLKFAGKIETGELTSSLATLCQRVEGTTTIENVHSSVNLIVSNRIAVGYVAGLVSDFNGVATLKNCSYSGTMSLNAGADVIAGIAARCTDPIGKGSNLVTIENCTFSGKLNYNTAEHKSATRIGGIIASQERNAVISGCTNSGEMVIDLNSNVIAKDASSGIGGLVGRCNGKTSDFTMNTVVKNSSFTGTITFLNQHPTQTSTYIGKVIGCKLDGYDDAQSVGNVETGTIKWDSKVSFANTETVSFAYGEKKDVEISADATLKAVSMDAPKGWTVDCSAWKSGKISVTAPASGKGDIEGVKELLLKATTADGKAILSSNAKTFRLLGINNQDELVAFTKSVDNMLNDGYQIDAKYLANNEIAINADITIPSGSLAYGAYWLKRLQTPLNGNEHTLTFNTTHGSRGGLVQNLGADVHDLKLAGTISAKDANAHIGSLACLLSKTGLTVSNVTSTVEITISNTGCRAGGLIGAGDVTFSKPVNFTMKDCQFNGKMNITANAYAVGGLIGDASDNNLRWTFDNCGSKATITVGSCKVASLGGLVGRGGAADNILTFNECEFGGSLSYTIGDDGYDLTRIGGLLGNLERGGVFTKCSFTGSITADWNGGRILGAGGGSCGVGGFVGRNTGHNDNAAFNIKAIFTDCVSKGTISIKNSTDSEGANKAYLGHFIGSSNNSNATTHVETDCKYESVITVNGTELTIEK